MNNKDKFAFIFLMLLYNLSLYFIFNISVLAAVIMNTIIMLILSYIALRYDDRVFEILEEIRGQNAKK